jgi:hypothetical protein
MASNPSRTMYLQNMAAQIREYERQRREQRSANNIKSNEENRVFANQIHNFVTSPPNDSAFDMFLNRLNKNLTFKSGINKHYINPVMNKIGLNPLILINEYKYNSIGLYHKLNEVYYYFSLQYTNLDSVKFNDLMVEYYLMCRKGQTLSRNNELIQQALLCFKELTGILKVKIKENRNRLPGST